MLIIASAKRNVRFLSFPRKRESRLIFWIPDQVRNDILYCGYYRKSSFSLIEVLVFVTILSVFFVLAASVVTVSLRNMKFNEHKIKATHYSRQLEEWLRVQTEIDWGGDLCNGCSSPINFTQNVTQQGNAGDYYKTIFCFNGNLISGWQALGLCSAYDLETIFKREVTFTSQPVSDYVTQVNASITLYWLELGQLKSITSNTIFSVLEQQ